VIAEAGVLEQRKARSISDAPVPSQDLLALWDACIASPGPAH
jgi:hypothetical protein